MRPAFHFAAAAFGPRVVRGVEVGVEHGLNASQALAEWPYGELHLTLVDISPDNFDEVEARLAIYGPDRTHIFKLETPQRSQRRSQMSLSTSST